MAIREGECYVHPQQEWDAAKCAKLTNATQRDGMGTPYPFKGYVGHLIGTSQKFNGGCVRNGDWWEGEIYPIPKVAEGYKIVCWATWGLRIMTEAEAEAQKKHWHEPFDPRGKW